MAKLPVLGNSTYWVGMADCLMYSTFTKPLSVVATESVSPFSRLSAQTTISTYPRDTTVQVNHTAFLSCVVSHDPELDLQTDWLFQGKPLYWKDAHYRKVRFCFLGNDALLSP